MMEIDELTKIALHFGVNTQLVKLQEEINEFTEAVEDYENYLNEDNTTPNKQLECKLREHITEEMGDVLNVLEGLKGVYHINDDLLKAHRFYKRVRTDVRNEEGYYEKD